MNIFKWPDTVLMSIARLILRIGDLFGVNRRTHIFCWLYATHAVQPVKFINWEYPVLMIILVDLWLFPMLYLGVAHIVKTSFTKRWLDLLDSQSQAEVVSYSRVPACDPAYRIFVFWMAIALAIVIPPQSSITRSGMMILLFSWIFLVANYTSPRGKRLREYLKEWAARLHKVAREVRSPVPQPSTCAAVSTAAFPYLTLFLLL